MDEARLGDIMRRADAFRRVSLFSFPLECANAAQDNNYGLLVAVYEAIPARKIIRMRDTYVRMDIGKLATRISGPFNDVSPDEAEQLVLQLVRSSRIPRTPLTILQVTQGDLFAKITHPTDGSATVEFTDDPALYNSSQTIDELGVLAMRMQGMGATLAGLEQSLSTHESWLKEVSPDSASEICVLMTRRSFVVRRNARMSVAKLESRWRLARKTSVAWEVIGLMLGSRALLRMEDRFEIGPGSSVFTLYR